MPRGKRRNDAIWIIVDRLTKFALFLPVKMTDPVDKLAKIYVNEIVRFHGVQTETQDLLHVSGRACNMHWEQI